ncbi:unnamed protein product [Cylicocyclus nassatus]|uniref:F-box domain-containing protein n=1 Tax=Cylicocyclus nassatus TaxID=53992 RepID=A0AA36GN54_CYLNA|nr:unnamed protein product [Cylicocyclus nassatus]
MLSGMATKPRSDKGLREVVHAEVTSKTCEKAGELVHFPFFALPVELCVRILKYAREDGEKFRETRLVCRAMNDIIESNRAIIGPMRLQRLFVGQHSAFDQGPKRFVVSDLKKLPDRLSSCAHTSIQQAFFYKELQRNHVHIRGMVFYRVVFKCDGKLLIELFDALRIVCLIVLECQLPGNLAEFLARHEFIAKMKSHFIGSTDSFFYYNCIINSEGDEWLKWFMKFTFPSVMAPPLPLDDLFNTRVLCSVEERLRSVALNRESPVTARVLCRIAEIRTAGRTRPRRTVMRLRSGKVVGDVVHAELTSESCDKPGDFVHFPFFALPLELCVRILKYVREGGGKFHETRLVCRAMNDIIEKNRAIIGPMLLQRLFIGQHPAFDQGPKRFVLSDPKELPNRLSSCAHAYIQQTIFYKISFEASLVKYLIRELLHNRVHIRAMIFYGVDFDCEGNVLVEFFEASRIACLIMLECQLPDNMAEFLAHHEFIAKISHFIGSTDSFWYHDGPINGSQEDDLLKWFTKEISIVYRCERGYRQSSLGRFAIL